MNTILHDSTISVTSAPNCVIPWCVQHDDFGNVCTGAQSSIGEHAVSLTRSDDDPGTVLLVSLFRENSIIMTPAEALKFADEMAQFSRLLVERAHAAQADPAVIVSSPRPVIPAQAPRAAQFDALEASAQPGAIDINAAARLMAKEIDAAYEYGVKVGARREAERRIAGTADLEAPAKPKTLADRIRHADSDECNEIHADLIDTYGRDCANALWSDAVREVEQNGEVA